MGKFSAVGMRERLPETYAGHRTVAVNTCSSNDAGAAGDDLRWDWANPTNRAVTAYYANVSAASTEALWQGCKVFHPGGEPDPLALAGDWRRGKARRPLGHWAGPGAPLIADPGAARRAVYLPAYRRQVEEWLGVAEVADRVARARAHPGIVLLRDWDTGRGVDRDGPMSHAWVLAVWLNTGEWPR